MLWRFTCFCCCRLQAESVVATPFCRRCLHALAWCAVDPYHVTKHLIYLLFPRPCLGVLLPQTLLKKYVEEIAELREELARAKVRTDRTLRGIFAAGAMYVAVGLCVCLRSVGFVIVGDDSATGRQLGTACRLPESFTQMSAPAYVFRWFKDFSFWSLLVSH